MTNLAHITTIKLDNLETLLKEWEILLEHLKSQNFFVKDINISSHITLQLENFTNYFQTLFFRIKDELGIQLTDYRIFYHDELLYPTKLQTSIIHKDINRLAAISIPIIINDPVVFYDDDSTYDPNIRERKVKKPNQIHTYEMIYPTLINTSSLHNVFIMDEKKSRVLIQINLYESFNDILNRNQNKLKLV